MTGVLRQRDTRAGKHPQKTLAVHVSETEAGPNHFSQPSEGPKPARLLDLGL